MVFRSLHSAIPANDHFDLAVLELSALDRSALGTLLSGDRVVGIFLPDPVLHLGVEAVPLVILTDPSPVGSVGQSFPTDIVSRLPDMLPANDDVGPLGPLVALVAKKRHGFRMHFDLVLARENGMWKPSGAPFRYVLKQWQLNPRECAVVGDSLFDIQAGESAGIGCILIISQDSRLFSIPGIEIFPDVQQLKFRISQLI